MARERLRTAYGAASVRERARFAWRPGPDAMRDRARWADSRRHSGRVPRQRRSSALWSRREFARRVEAACDRASWRMRTSQIEVGTRATASCVASGEAGSCRSISRARGRIDAAARRAEPSAAGVDRARQPPPRLARGSFVALAPHAADSPAAARVGVDELVAPRIVGSVTRETQGGSSRRATPRFVSATRTLRIRRTPARVR